MTHKDIESCAVELEMQDIIALCQTGKVMFSDYPDVLTVAQVSEMLQISKKKVYELTKKKVFRKLDCTQRFMIPKIYVINYVLSTRM